MTNNSEWVMVMEPTSAIKTQIVKGLLESAQIPVHVEGEYLTDEFAMSQMLVNRSGVAVLVPHERLADAQNLIHMAMEAGQKLASKDDWQVESSKDSGIGVM